MRAYITMLGRSSWATINSYYAVLMRENYRPERIYIVVEEAYRSKLEKTEEALRIISEAFGINPEIESVVIENASFLEAEKRVVPIIRKLKSEGFEVAVDITGGRKAVVVGTLIKGLHEGIDHVYYLAITELSFADRPYMMIPLHVQHLRDFMREMT
ncbi:hypothetical protein [Palaeococcus ferrophilus]|uniref:hypothetical protein n=1 Tax=Palaeococcus ferrophilus TaxID=83868 RepID=UPI00064F9CBF|nr:hypothetical protein [Palaeococcus ferrophilus]